GDVEQSDRQALEGGRPGDTFPRRRLPLAGGIQHDPSHVRTSLVTGWLPVAPLAQLPMIAENSPALPPACTSHNPSGRNFGSVESANASGSPSAMPPAPRTNSDPGICNSSCNRALTFAL